MVVGRFRSYRRLEPMKLGSECSKPPRACSCQERTGEMELFGDNFIPVIPVDELEHTSTQPFCWDETCPCHEDQDSIQTVAQQVQDGLFTPKEATDFVRGRGI
jgi:hypothetical protein